MKKILTVSLFLLVMTISAMAQGKSFCIAKDGKTATIVVDEQDWKGVVRTANDLGDDVRKVCGTASPVVNDMSLDNHNIVVGTIGNSRIIDKLIKQKKLVIIRLRRTLPNVSRLARRANGAR